MRNQKYHIADLKKRQISVLDTFTGYENAADITDVKFTEDGENVRISNDIFPVVVTFDQLLDLLFEGETTDQAFVYTIK